MLRPILLVIGSGPQALSTISHVQSFQGTSFSVVWVTKPNGKCSVAQPCFPLGTAVEIVANRCKLHTSRHMIGQVSHLSPPLEKNGKIVEVGYAIVNGERVEFDAAIVALNPTDELLPFGNPSQGGRFNGNDPLDCQDLVKFIRKSRTIEYFVLPEKEQQEKDSEDDDEDEDDDKIAVNRPTTLVIDLPAVKSPLKFPRVMANFSHLAGKQLGNAAVAEAITEHALNRLSETDPMTKSKLLLSRIISVDLSGNDLTDEIAAVIGKSFFFSPDDGGVGIRSTLKQLVLANNPKIGDCGMGTLLSAVIAGIAAKTCTLEEIDVSNTGLTEAIRPALCEVIATCPTLVVVRANNNNFGSVAAAAILRSARHRCTSMCLRNTGLSDQGGSTLPDIFSEVLLNTPQKRSSLKQLDIAENDIGNETARAIGQAVIQSSSLKLEELDVSACPRFSAEGVEFVCKALCAFASDCPIVRLNFKGCGAVGVPQVGAIGQLIDNCGSRCLESMSLNVLNPEQLAVSVLLEGARNTTRLTLLDIEFADGPRSEGDEEIPAHHMLDKSVLDEISEITRRNAVAKENRELEDLKKRKPECPWDDIAEILAETSKVAGGVNTLHVILRDTAAKDSELWAACDRWICARAQITALPENVTHATPEECGELIKKYNKAIDGHLFFGDPTLPHFLRKLAGPTAVRVPVTKSFALSKHPKVFVIGDAAAHPCAVVHDRFDLDHATDPDTYRSISLVSRHVVSSAIISMFVGREVDSSATLRFSLPLEDPLAKLIANKKSVARDIALGLHWTEEDTESEYLATYRIAEVLEETLRLLNRDRPVPFVDLSSLTDEEIKEQVAKQSAEREATARRLREERELREKAQKEAEKKAAAAAVKGTKGKKGEPQSSKAEETASPIVVEASHAHSFDHNTTEAEATGAAEPLDTWTFLISVMKDLENSGMVRPYSVV